MNAGRIRRGAGMVVVPALLVLAGCASNVTPPTVTTPIAASAGHALHVTAVTVDTASGVWAGDSDLDTIRARILGLVPDATAGATDCTMQVQLTRFDKGSAAARLALIGLGQIHIEGIVTLTDAGGRQVGQYKIRKTFAGGGMAGGMTTLADVERGFAKSVVAPLSDAK